MNKIEHDGTCPDCGAGMDFVQNCNGNEVLECIYCRCEKLEKTIARQFDHIAHLMSFHTIEQKVLDWSNKRGILLNSTSNAQLLKAISEVGELADAFAKQNKSEMHDAIGDILVCLINLCYLDGTTITYCLEKAYDEIKDRKGYLNAQGVFVKENA
jgi:uncharacterized protein YabN with tetrapyrrole methylase and pyrophosphatase domain